MLSQHTDALIHRDTEIAVYVNILSNLWALGKIAGLSEVRRLKTESSYD